MKFIKLAIIKICFKIIERLIDESDLVEMDPEFEAMVDNLVDGVDIGSINKQLQMDAKEFVFVDGPGGASGKPDGRGIN